MHQITFLCLTPDADHIGRFDPSFLTQQARMEILVQNSRSKSAVCTDEGDFKPISEWPGVTFNSDGEVTCLTRTWGSDLYAGTVDFRWLPETVGTLSLPYAKTEGLFRAVDFPRRMAEIRLRSNWLKGSVETAQLPTKLVELSLTSNQISGTINLRTLPEFMEILLLTQNKITGTVNLQHLPHWLRVLDLRANALCGDLIVANLPDSLTRLNVSYNRFMGKLEVEGRTFETLKELRAVGNSFLEIKYGEALPKGAIFSFELV